MYAYVNIHLYSYIDYKKLGSWYCSQYIYWEFCCEQKLHPEDEGGILQI